MSGFGKTNAADKRGVRFGRLVGVRATKTRRHAAVIWVFRCDCGAQVTRLPPTRATSKTSCGCSWHGESQQSSPEYRAWMSMRERCGGNSKNQRNKKHYADRGITVCPEWNSFPAFLEAVGRRPTPKHSLDRINNDGNYEPGNVRWATPAQQHGNTRSARRITFAGKTLSLTAWAQALGLSPQILHMRFRHGWSVEKALTPTRYRTNGKPR